jgi:transcriptional regulator with XRE-family HTH domain
METSMKRLKQARQRYGLTQSELAERLGTTQQTIARWETGKAEPSLAALRDLAICLCTTVDSLLGRAPVLEHQTPDPSAWITGDKSGYWGNIGIRLPHDKLSIWYPITTSTMERIFGELQSAETNTWISFQTLNNKMVVCRPSQLQVLTFLDEAEDQIEDDWEVGPDDVEGWPQEIYECLEYLMWEELGVPGDEEEFSDKLIAGTKELISEHQLGEKKLMEMCVKTRVTHTDGTTRLLHVSPERLANTMFDFDVGMEHTGSTMLHLDDEGGDHSVFLSLDLISRLELPLLALKRGMEDREDEYARDDASGTPAKSESTKSRRTRRARKKRR